MAAISHSCSNEANYQTYLGIVMSFGGTAGQAFLDNIANGEGAIAAGQRLDYDGHAFNGTGTDSKAVAKGLNYDENPGLSGME